MVLAYSLATLHGQQMQALRVEAYAGRIQKHQDKAPRHSDFSYALYGQRWMYAMDIWSQWAFRLMALKPHKSLHFHRGLHALCLMQQAV